MPFGGNVKDLEENIENSGEELVKALSGEENVETPQVEEFPQFDVAAIRQQHDAELAQYQQALFQQRAVQEQYEDALAAQQIAALPEDEQQAAVQFYHWQKGIKRQWEERELANAALVAYVKQLEESVLPLVKDKVFTHMSQQHQIEKELLKLADSPKEAEKIAKILVDYRKKMNFEKRKETGVDKVASTSEQTSAATQLPELKKRYQGSGKIAEYLREMKKLGY